MNLVFFCIFLMIDIDISKSYIYTQRQPITEIFRHEGSKFVFRSRPVDGSSQKNTYYNIDHKHYCLLEKHLYIFAVKSSIKVHHNIEIKKNKKVFESFKEVEADC